MNIRTTAAERLLALCVTPRTAAEIIVEGGHGLMGNTARTLLMRGLLQRTAVNSQHSPKGIRYVYQATGIPYTPRRRGRPPASKLVFKDEQVSELRALLSALHAFDGAYAERIEALLAEANTR